MVWASNGRLDDKIRWKGRPRLDWPSHRLFYCVRSDVETDWTRQWTAHYHRVVELLEQCREDPGMWLRQGPNEGHRIWRSISLASQLWHTRWYGRCMVLVRDASPIQVSWFVDSSCCWLVFRSLGQHRLGRWDFLRPVLHLTQNSLYNVGPLN